MMIADDQWAKGPRSTIDFNKKPGFSSCPVHSLVIVAQDLSAIL